MSSTSKKQIKLRSSDGWELVMDGAAAELSKTIKSMMEVGCAEGVIPLPNVKGSVLMRVISYCSKHAEEEDSGSTSSNPPAAAEDEQRRMKKWDREFVKVHQSEMVELIKAANYLSIKGLLHLTCQAMADMIKGKSPEQIRRTFNIVNDFTPEEEEQVRRETQWAFQDS